MPESSSTGSDKFDRGLSRLTLESVRNEDTGPADETLNRMVGTVRGFERGVFDIEAVKRANAALIETIEDSLRIAEDGRQKRAEAGNQLEKLETELRETLISACARASAGNITTTD